MTYAPTDPDAYPDETPVKEVSCRKCDEPVYVPARDHPTGAREICHDCLRDRLADRYQSADTHAEAVRALDRIESHDMLPVEDDRGRLVVGADTEHYPSTGWELRSITRLVPVADAPLTDRERCPDCGYDRCYVRAWRAPGGVETGEVVSCVACEEPIAEASTL